MKYFWIAVVAVIFIGFLIYGYFRFISILSPTKEITKAPVNRYQKGEDRKFQFETKFKYLEQGILNEKTVRTIRVYNNKVLVFECCHNYGWDRITNTKTCVPFTIVNNVEVNDRIEKDGHFFVTIKTNGRATTSVDGGSEFASSSDDVIVMANVAGGDSPETMRKNAADLKAAIEKALALYAQTSEYKRHIEIQSENKQSDFYQKFKAKYGLDFEKWDDDKNVITLCRRKIDDLSNWYALVLFPNNVITVVQYFENPSLLTPEQKLIYYSRAILGDEYNRLIKAANFEVFDSFLYKIDGIISITFVKKIDETHLGNVGSVSGFDMAVKSELFGTAYAIGDAMEKMGSTTFKSDDSHYKLLFKTNPIQTLYVGKMWFEHSDILKNHKHKLEVEMAELRQKGGNQKEQGSVLDEIRKAKELLDSGVLTKEEFDALKEKLLG